MVYDRTIYCIVNEWCAIEDNVFLYTFFRQFVSGHKLSVLRAFARGSCYCVVLNLLLSARTHAEFQVAYLAQAKQTVFLCRIVCI